MPCTSDNCLARSSTCVVRSSTPAAAIKVESAWMRSGLSMVSSGWPRFTLSPTMANSFTMRPWYGGNTWAAMSSLKSMLPTASVWIGNERSDTVPTLISPS
jgi:hypothetical protein